jgi:uncharacterized membrane protein
MATSRTPKTVTASAAAEACGNKTVDAQYAALPSWKRSVIALVANVLTVGVGLYVGMSITVVVTNMATALAGLGFIAWMIYFIGYTITWLGSLLAGFLVQNLIIEGGAAKAVSEKFDTAKSRAGAAMGRAGAWFSAIKMGA